jgi:dihydrofolate synthase/folylpolyglutamate synthase
LRVGLFTSPHLVSFRERIQVNRELISEAAVVRLVGEMQPIFKEFPSDHHPTFFEVVTVMALKYFAGRQCDLVIWETGLGGRLDATNIVTPLASVITNIGFDHQQWLGETLAQIATEKAGIIKPGVAIVTAEEGLEALAVIARTAKSLMSPMTVVGTNHTSLVTHHSPPLLGEHQRLNAALAVATVEALQEKIPVSNDAIRIGLETVHWPGRLQLVRTAPGQTILLDGAHNVAGAEALRRALIELFPTARPALVLGVLQDKDYRQICGTLAPLAEHIVTVPVASERAASPEALREVCRHANPAAQVTACPLLTDALSHVADDPFVVITGSLYLVGEAMELLRLSPAPDGSERELNEWTVKK